MFSFLNSLLSLDIGESLKSLWESTGLHELVSTFTAGGWQNLVMILIACVLFYLAIVKKFEPLLLLPIAFGMFIVNIPGVYHILFGTKGYTISSVASKVTVATGTSGELSALFGTDLDALLKQLKETEAGKNYVLSDAISYFLANNSVTIDGVTYAANALTTSTEQVIRDFGLFYYIYKGVDWVIFPPIIFLGIGAMTDFGPLLANPKSFLLGAAAQIGIFATFLGALVLGFNYAEASSIGIIGGADGPTAIYLTSKLAPNLLGPIAVAAYSYMALVPVIQPPIMKMLTTQKEREIVMKQLRKVSKTEKIIFPIIVTVFVSLLLPSAAPLIGCLMLGNLMRESGVVERLSKTVQNELMNITTIFLGVSVGATTTATAFLNYQTLAILVIGILAFALGSAGGVLLAKFMNLFTKNKINPLIGSAGVSAVPMAARVSQTVGQEANPGNFLLMHAMGPNVAGVIGSAVAAGILLSFLG